MKGEAADEIVLGSPTINEMISDERHPSDIEELYVSVPGADRIEEETNVVENDAEVESVPSSFVEPLESPGDLKNDDGQKSPSKFKFSLPNVNLPTFRRKKYTVLPESDIPRTEITDVTGTYELSTQDDPSVIKEISSDDIVLGSPTFDKVISDERLSPDFEELDVSVPSGDSIEEDAIVLENNTEVESVPSSFVETLESPGDLQSEEGQRSPSKFKISLSNVNFPTFRRKKDSNLPEFEVPTNEGTDEIEIEQIEEKRSSFGFGMKLPDFCLPSFGRKSEGKEAIFKGKSINLIILCIFLII
jgi:hypothetical protein